MIFFFLAALKSWYKYLGWECLMGFTMLIGILKSCGSFLWAKQCFANTHERGDVKPIPRKEEIALGVFELLYVVSLFVALLITKHDVHPWAGDPKAERRGRRAARPGRESFVRRSLQAIGKEKGLLWWSCVTLWQTASILTLVMAIIIAALDHHNLADKGIWALFCTVGCLLATWYGGRDRGRFFF